MKFTYRKILISQSLKIALLFTFVYFFCACGGSETNNGSEKKEAAQKDSSFINKNNKGSAVIPDSVKGDFNGDGKTEFVWLEPVEQDSAGNCGNHCECLVKFSDASLPLIRLGKDLYGGHLINQGNLNDNGADEFSVVPFGDASEWSACTVYTLKNGKWEQAIEPFSVFGSADDYVSKDPQKKGFAIISVYENSDKEGIVLKTKSVKIK
jgi:hypothetical protein